jgi:hypothetical protein
VVLLCVPDEDALLAELGDLVDAGVPHAAVREPDLDNEYTAVAVAPTHYGRRFASLPLMGRAMSG